MVTEQLKAKGVDSRYMGTLEKHLLLDKMNISGIIVYKLPELGAEPFFQLRGSVISEGYDNYPVSPYT